MWRIHTVQNPHSINVRRHPGLQHPRHRNYKTSDIRTFNGRRLTDVNTSKMVDYLNCFKWDNLNIFDVNSAYESFVTVVQNGMDLFMPEKIVKLKGRNVLHNDWMTKGLLRCTTKCKKLFAKYARSGNETDRLSYTKYRNVLNSTKRRAKITYFNGEFSKNRGNMKKSWKLLNSLLGKCSNKQNIVSYLEVNGLRIHNKSSICNTFNDHFGGVGRKYCDNIPISKKSFEKYLGKKVENSFSFQNVDERNVWDLLRDLCNKNSCGHDNLSNAFIKKIAPGLVSPLTIIINKSLNEQIVPNSMKLAKISPLYKSGVKNLVTNYRPISLLPVFSKLLERVVHDQSANFFDENNVIDDHQFGFRKRHSCSDCVLKFVHDVHKNLLKNNYTMSIHADLSKAFDTLIRKNLFVKLEHYGIRGDSLRWFVNYFSDRKQYVRMGSDRSNNYDLEYGVGQGSILGPLIFQVAINDVYQIGKYSTIIGFADDTTLYHSYHNIVTLLARVKHDLRILIDWFRAHKMSFNPSKTHLMVFSNSMIRGFKSITVDEHDFVRVKQVKFLGITIDEHLSFVTHVDTILKKIDQGIFHLKRLRKLVPKCIKKQIYYSFIYSHLIYGIECWGLFIKNSLCTKINNKINVCIRQINLLKNTASIKSEGLVDGILPFKYVLYLHNMKLMYKKFYHISPNAICKLNFKKCDQTFHDYNTRNRGVYCSINNVFEKLENDWDELDPVIKNMCTVKGFSTKLKNSLMQKK